MIEQVLALEFYTYRLTSQTRILGRNYLEYNKSQI